MLHDGGKLLAVLADGAVDGDAQPLGEDRLQVGGPALLPGRREGALSGLGLPNGLGWEGSHLNGDEIRLEGEQGTEGELIFRADAEGQHGESGAFIRQEGGFGQGALLGAVMADEQPAQSEKKAGRGQREGKGAPKIGGAGMGMFHETPPGWNRWGAGKRGRSIWAWKIIFLKRRERVVLLGGISGRLWAAEGRHGGGTPPALRVARLRHRVAQLTKVWPPWVPLMQKSAEIRGKMQTKA